MLIPKMLSPAISQAKDCQSQRAADFTITATEHLQGFDLLQSFHLTAQSFISLSRINSKWEDAKFRVKYLNALAKAFSYGVSQLIYVGLYFIGAILVVTDHMSVGSLIAVAQLSVYIIAPLQTFSADVAEIISSKKIIEKLENLNGSGDEDKAWCSPPAEFQCLALDNISFSYGRNPVLTDVSYTFKKGKKYTGSFWFRKDNADKAAVRLTETCSGQYFSEWNIHRPDGPCRLCGICYGQRPKYIPF